ncbi:hypothetical protein ERHA55_22140 [Erwinia rhapontici]|nr:hypothetical protein [Erwinia rhapontici]BCQ44687.1 hypothetical protein ERHA55_22140 [Erwinia rhapontici]
MIALNRAAERNALYPTWRTAITPPELLSFTSAEIELKLDHNSSNAGNRSGAAKPAEPPAQERPDSDTAPYYYQLTEKDFASLTLRQTVLATFAKLEKQQFDQRSQLYNQLSALFTELNIPIAPPLDIDSLIDSYTIESSQPSTSATTSTSNSTSTSTSTNPAANAEGSNSETETQNSADKSSETPATSTQMIETSTQSDTQTSAPLIVWQLSPEALSNTIKELKITALSKEVLKTLAPLQDEVFPSLYFLQMAVNEAGIPPSSLQNMGVFELARKSGLSPAHAVPNTGQHHRTAGVRIVPNLSLMWEPFTAFTPTGSILRKGKRLILVAWIALATLVR